MKKRIFALFMAVALAATSTGISELGASVAHAAENTTTKSCGTNKTDHKNVTPTFKWKTDGDTVSCTATFKCDDCGTTFDEKCDVKDSITKKATCTAEGEVEYSATVKFNNTTYTNPQTLTMAVEATGHKNTSTTKAAKAATCTEDGYTAEVTCNDCKNVISASTVQKATGHKEVVTAGKAATCTEDGYTDETTCSTCKAVLKAKEVIPASHEYEAVGFEWNGYTECLATIGCENCDFTVEVECSEILLQKIAATCTEDGYDYYTAACEYDGEVFMSSKMGDESTIKPKLGHDYENDVCNRCNEPKPYSEIAFVKEETVETYTGEAVEVSEDVYEVTKGTGVVTCEYYVDEACTVPTYEGDDEKETSAPVDAGTYFVKAVITEDEDYRANDTESVHKLIIRPRAVSSFKAENTKSAIKLTWKENEQASGYIIYKKTDTTEYEPLVVIENGKKTSFTDDTIKQGTKYRYNIVAYKISENGEEVVSLKRSKGTNIIRTRLNITNASDGVSLKWTKVEDAEGYKVYRKAVGESKYSLLTTLKGEAKNSYKDTSSKVRQNGKASYYYVVPYYKSSSDVILKTGARTNYYMTRPTIESLTTSGSGALKVEWTSNTKGNGYQIRYSRNSDMENAKTITVDSKSTLSKKIKSLTEGKTYYVQVRSFKTYKDVNYYSAWSAKKSKKTK